MTPSFTVYLSSFDLATTTNGDHFIARMQALFVAPVTGTYTFFLRGDDYAFLYIGSNESPGSRQLVATKTQYGDFNE